jgi:enoyl-CoA hydratase/carnithine racemase
MADRHPEGQITTEVRGHLLLICVDRQEKRNGFTPKMFTELSAAYTRLENERELRCGLLYAAGDHFTAGLDLPLVAPLRKEGRAYFPAADVDPFNLRHPMRTKPLVAAMKGICYTLAIELMLAADVVIASDNCRFSQLEVKRGIMPGCGATHRMIERAGWGNAMKLLLTGDEFGAVEALRLGFVQEVVSPGKEFERALQVAAQIAEGAPLAVHAILEQARIAVNNGWLDAVSRIASTQQRLFNSEDAKEGVLSFQEKRPAKFVGR